MNTPEVLDRLQAAGHRLTQPRQVVVDAILAQQGQFTASELCDAVAARAPQVGRATIFRTMQILVDTGVLERVHSGTRRDAYVLDSDGHHHHLVCDRCGQITLMEGCGIDEFLARATQRYGFAISRHFIEVFGRCHDCAQPDAGPLYQPHTAHTQ